MQRGLVKTPGLITGPGRALELVLDIEQPDTDRRSQNHDREVHQQSPILRKSFSSNFLCEFTSSPLMVNLLRARSAFTVKKERPAPSPARPILDHALTGPF